MIESPGSERVKVWGFEPVRKIFNESKSVSRGKLGKVVSSSANVLTVQIGKRIFLLSAENDVSNLKSGDTIRFWMDPDSAPSEHLKARVIASFDLEDKSFVVGEKNDAKLRIPIPSNMKPEMVPHIGEKFRLVLDKLDERSLRIFERFLIFADLSKLSNASPSEIKQLCEAFKSLASSIYKETSPITESCSYVMTSKGGFRVPQLKVLDLLKLILHTRTETLEKPEHLQINVVEKNSDIDMVVAKTLDGIKEMGIRSFKILPGLLMRTGKMGIEISLFTRADLFNRLLSTLEPLLGKTSPIFERNIGNAVILQPVNTPLETFEPGVDFLDTSIRNKLPPTLLIKFPGKEVWNFSSGSYSVTVMINTEKESAYMILDFTSTLSLPELEKEASNVTMFMREKGFKVAKRNAILMKAEGFIPHDHLKKIETFLKNGEKSMMFKRFFMTKSHHLQHPPNKVYRVISRISPFSIPKNTRRKERKMRLKDSFKVDNASRKDLIKLMETLNEKLRASPERMGIEKTINRFLLDSVRFFWLKQLANGEVYVNEKKLETPQGRRKIYSIFLALRTPEYGEVEGWIHVNEKMVSIIAKMEKRPGKARIKASKLLRKLENLGFEVVDIRFATHRKELVLPMLSREGFEIYG